MSDEVNFYLTDFANEQVLWCQISKSLHERSLYSKQATAQCAVSLSIMVEIMDELLLSVQEISMLRTACKFYEESSHLSLLEHFLVCGFHDLSTENFTEGILKWMVTEIFCSHQEEG